MVEPICDDPAFSRNALGASLVVADGGDSSQGRFSTPSAFGTVDGDNQPFVGTDGACVFGGHVSLFLSYRGYKPGYAVNVEVILQVYRGISNECFREDNCHEEAPLGPSFAYGELGPAGAGWLVGLVGSEHVVAEDVEDQAGHDGVLLLGVGADRAQEVATERVDVHCTVVREVAPGEGAI